MRNAAIVAVALFAAAGHAPSAEAAAVAGVPMMWSNSGGGWRAMAASMGFSRAFDRAGLLSDPSLAKVASNSGGSWFLAQFAFSDAFYNSVVGETDLRKVVVAWMQKQAPLLRQPLPEILDDVDEWVGENIAGRLLKGVITALYKVPRSLILQLCLQAGDKAQQHACASSIDELTSALMVVAQFEGSWGRYIEKTIELADPLMAKLPATASARKGGLLAPDLHFQIANMTSSFANALGEPAENTFRMNASKSPFSATATPMQYVVPSATNANSFARAGYLTSELVQSYGALNFKEGATPAVYEPAVPILGGDVAPVWYIAALSSAFAAATASPANLLAMMGVHADYSGEAPRGVQSQLATRSEHEDLQNAASEYESVSTTNGQSLAPKCQAVITDHCDKMGDSSWQLISCVFGLFVYCPESFLSYLADFAPCTQSADINSDFSSRQCDFPNVRIADGAYADNTALAQTVGSLQKLVGAEEKIRAVAVLNYDGTDIATTNMSDISVLFAPDTPITTGPISRIFKAPWSSVKFQKVAGTKYIYQAQISTSTVYNLAYDVDNGSPIDVLILAAIGPIPLVIGISDQHSDMELLGAYAADAGLPPVSDVVSEWLAQTSGMPLPPPSPPAPPAPPPSPLTPPPSVVPLMILVVIVVVCVLAGVLGALRTAAPSAVRMQ